jgi:hypothetical protein
MASSIRGFCGMLWLAMVAEAVLFAPPTAASTSEQILQMLQLETRGIEPLAYAAFQIMGILPLMSACLLAHDSSRLSAWPFILSSFLLGSFSLLPYLSLRSWDPPLSDAGSIKDAALSKWAGLVPGTGAIALVLYGVNEGDPHHFFELWRSDKFVHILGLDMLGFLCVLGILTAEDARRRGQSMLWGVVPMLGPIMWLSVRGRFTK